LMVLGHEIFQWQSAPRTPKEKEICNQDGPTKNGKDNFIPLISQKKNFIPLKLSIPVARSGK
jgi:hypothetical protein